MTWRQNALARIARERPALVFATSINGYTLAVDDQPVEGRAAQDAQTQGWVRTLTALRADGSAVVLLRDTPDMGRDVAGCVSANMDDLAQCAVPRRKAIVAGQSDELAQDRLGDVPGLTTWTSTTRSARGHGAPRSSATCSCTATRTT